MVRRDELARPRARGLIYPLTALGILLGGVLVQSSEAAVAEVAEAPEPGSVRGVVVRHDGDPAGEGEVLLVDLRRSAHIDAEGQFQMLSLAPGRYLLEATSPREGRGVERVEVRAGEETVVEIRLDLAVFGDQVVVTASPDARSQLEVAQPTSVLAGEELETRLGTSLGETLENEPGVSSTSFGPGAGRPIIRGLGGDRVRMLQDGLSTGDVSSTSPDHAVGVEPLAAERIEVLRGPATLLYGSSAVGGVVNVLDGRIPDRLPSTGLSGEAELVGGTVGNERSTALSLGGGLSKLAWHADFERRRTGDLEIPDEAGLGNTLANSALSTRGGSLGLSYVGSSGFLGVSVNGLDSLYGVPGSVEEGPGGEEEEVRIDLEQRRVDLRGGWVRGSGFLQGVKLRLGVADYEHQELEGEGLGTRFENQDWEGRLELVQRQRAVGDGGFHSGIFGLQAGSSDFSALGEEAFVPPSVTDRWAVFTFQELHRGDLRYQLGGRFERQEIDVEGRLAGPSRSLDGLSASLGLVWEPGDIYSVGLSLTRTTRLPTATELYADGPHLATGTFEVGDVGLGKENSLGFDLSVRKRRGRLTGMLNLFSNRFDDYIFERFTGERRESLDVVRFTQRDAELKGAEVDALVSLLRLEGDGHLDLQLRGDYVRAELRQSGEPLPRIPPLRLGLGLKYHRGRLRSQIEVRRVEEQDRVADHETSTPGYTLLHASLSYRFFPAGQVMDLLLRGENLGDRLARAHTSFLKDEAPLPGRDLSVAVRFYF